MQLLSDNAAPKATASKATANAAAKATAKAPATATAKATRSTTNAANKTAALVTAKLAAKAHGNATAKATTKPTAKVIVKAAAKPTAKAAGMQQATCPLTSYQLITLGEAEHLQLSKELLWYTLHQCFPLPNHPGSGFFGCCCLECAGYMGELPESCMWDAGQYIRANKLQDFTPPTQLYLHTNPPTHLTIQH